MAPPADRRQSHPSRRRSCENQMSASRPRSGLAGDDRVRPRLWRATIRCALEAAVLISTSVQFASKLEAAVVEGTVRLIVNFPAGSGTADTIARMMSTWLAHKWMQPVLVENRPGMTGNVGAESVFAAAPDGRTLLVTPPGPLTVAPLLRTLTFDPRQFVPVTILVTTPTVLVARPNLPAQNLAELIDYARTHPGPIKAANQGSGSTSHLAAEWLRVEANIDIVHVPFRGSVAALQGLADGRVDLMLDNLGSSRGPIASGQVKVLGVASAQPEAALPNVPVMADQLPGFISATWVAVMAPPQTAYEITGKLSGDLAEGLAQPEIAARIRQNGCEPVGITPDATARFVEAETDKWSRVVNMKGFRTD
jgi:tripartite-type tricarboxylate transporter receptor subunit TctC